LYLVWLCTALLVIGGTDCDTLIDGMLQSQCDRADHDSYKQYYEHGGCDAKTADRQADFDVLWDRMSEQH